MHRAGRYIFAALSVIVGVYGSGVPDLTALDLTALALAIFQAKTNDSAERLIPPAKGLTRYYYLAKGSQPGAIPTDPICQNSSCADKSVGAFIRASLEDYNDLTPIHFVEIEATDTSNHNRPYIYFANDPMVSNGGHTWDISSAEAAPYLSWLKTGDHVIAFSPTLWTTAPTGVELSPHGGSRIPLHETGHALGRYHEQDRADADQFLSIFKCCISSGDAVGHAFDPHLFGGQGPLAPYDPNSIMQYSSENFCRSDSHLPPDPTGQAFPDFDNKCICYPMLANSRFSRGGVPSPKLTQYAPQNSPNNTCDPSFTQTGYMIDHNAGILSAEDINQLFLAYPPQLGEDTPESQYGAALVSADFDGDGYMDLAVGAPRARKGLNQAPAGIVYVYKGTYLGLVPWRVLSSDGSIVGVANDDFGAALAAIDVDGDGKSELIVGAPGQSSGNVHVFQGTRSGPAPVGRLAAVFSEDKIQLPDLPQDSDQFGAVIATARISGKPSLVVGAPGKDASTGRIFVLQWSADATLTPITNAGAGMSKGDLFGTSIAAGVVDNSLGTDSLVVGAPGAGKAYFFPFASGFPLSTHRLTLTPLSTVSGEHPTARFGQAVALARLVLNFAPSEKYVIVGSPGNTGDPGEVWVFRITKNTDGSYSVAQSIRQASPQDEPSGQFGSSLATTMIKQTGLDDIAIGAPNANAGKGAVYLANGSGPTLALHLSSAMGKTPVHFHESRGDKLGNAVSFGDFNHDGFSDLAIGAPVKSSANIANSGAVSVIKGQDGSAHLSESPDTRVFTNYLVPSTVEPRELSGKLAN